ncbi:homoserine dehydrogenase-domain-containing protein [Tuber brumale]|nr:homoserine dehydrogenase-domain-containing protein [Tuber brumale]
MSNVYVAVIGAGGVGKSFISQLNAYALRNKKHTISTILISRSSKALLSKDYSGLNLTTWESDITSASSSVKPPSFPDETLKFLTSAPGPVILVDNTSSEAIAEEYPRFLSSGVHLVTPNKKGFSSSLALFKAIYAASEAQGGGYVFHEATVGAGLPVLSTLKDLIDTGDEIVKVEGVFSGTMSYLFNSFAPLSSASGAEKPFSACVAEARELGYTEPDPRDDLNGLDVARKLTILARLSGLLVSEPTSFPIQSLIPKPLESAANAEEFLAGLADFDGEMHKVKTAAESEGAVVRYVGSLDVVKGEVSVGLRNFDRGSAVAGLKGSDNIISFYTRRYGERAMIVQGAGAGAEVTAMGVLGDLIKVLERLK